MKLSPAFIFLVLAVSVWGQEARATAERAELRGRPHETARVVETLKRDAPLEIIKQNGAWFLVQSLDYVGWINGSSIKIVNTAKEALVVPSLGGTERVTDASGETTIIDQATQPSTPRPATVPKTRTKQTTDSRTYIRGPRGGCYYINSSGKKTYVDHSHCN